MNVEAFFGIRVQDVFMNNNEFYKIVGFDTEQAIIDNYRTTAKGAPSLLKINHQSDLARLGVIKELTFTVIPVDKKRYLLPFGLSYTTAVPCSINLASGVVARKIYAHKFTFKGANDSYDYIVKPGSVKERRAKNTSPTFS